MKKQYIIVDAASSEVFCGSNLDGVNFDSQSEIIAKWVRKFESEQEAKDRLVEEIGLFPAQFENRLCTIIPVYVLEG